MAGTVAVVLAAGQSRRMHSRWSKVLHRVGGMPAVERVVRAVAAAGIIRTVVVVGGQGEAVRQALAAYPVTFAVQSAPRGTGDAVGAATAEIGGAEQVLVVYADGAVLTGSLLAELVERHVVSGATATLLTGEMDDPAGYGRIVRGPGGEVRAIVEEVDCTPEQRAIREWNTGVGCYRRERLLAALARVGTANAKGEAYLTDVADILVAAGDRVEAFCTPAAAEAIGVNDRAELAAAERIVRQRAIRRLWETGVTVQDPATAYVDERAEIGQDTIIGPCTVIEGPCRIGGECRIGPGAHIRSSELGVGVTVLHSVVEDSVIEDGCSVGPFAHLRPGSVLRAEVEVGNFAEVKNSVVGAGSKAHHHCYVGDADLGERVNVGAGVITVNYDGRSKHRTRVADGAFLGCNVNLIAPIEVGEGAYVAAGSTVTDPVPGGALAIARERQTNKPGWARARRDAP